MSHRRRTCSGLATNLLFVALFACCSASEGRARAQPAAAEALFRAGREAAARQEHATACAKFRESYRIEPAVGTLLNIAMCEEELGELSRAWAHFQEALHALPNEDPRREVVTSRLAKLDALLPRLTIGLARAAPPETRVIVGAIELTSASFDVPVPYDPGQYAIDVIAPGRAKRSYAVALAPGQREALLVEPGPQEHASAPEERPSAPELRVIPPVQPPAPIAPPRETSDATQRAAGWALIGAAGVSVLAAAIAGGFVIDRASTVADHCPNDRCDDEGELAAESGRAAWTVLIAAGLTALTTTSLGAYLLIDAEPSRAVAGAGVNGRF